jgi:hypothetical protein
MRVFENRVLRNIFGLKRDETVGGWRKMHNEELHNMYSSLNVTTCIMIKSRRMRWKGHVVLMCKREVIRLRTRINRTIL